MHEPYSNIIDAKSHSTKGYESLKSKASSSWVLGTNTLLYLRRTTISNMNYLPVQRHLQCFLGQWKCLNVDKQFIIRFVTL